jgi:hypothetical protein
MPKKRTPVSQFARFQSLIRGLVAVPKKEIAVEEERYRKERAAKKKPAT